MSDEAPDDPEDGTGRQFERTALAHWRTVLAAAVVGLLIIRQSDAGGERVAATVGALAGLLGIALAGIARQEELRHQSVAGAHRVVAGIVAGLAVMQAAALVVVL